MRLIMVGTGAFAVPAFRRLLETPHTVVALVTRPREVPKGRPHHSPAPMRAVAEAHGIPILDPPDINAPAANAQLRQLQPEVLVVCDFGQILSAETLATARHGGINIHGSLLPKYRGAAPVNWAIYHGETVTGVSLIHMTPRVDAGPVVARAATPIDPEETAVDLEARLAELGASLLPDVLDAIAAGTLQPLPQDPRQASKAPRLKKTDGLIDWSRPAWAIKNQVRAMEPWPKTYAFWHRPTGPPLRLILGPVQVLEEESELLQRLRAGVPPSEGHGESVAKPLAFSPGTAPGTVLEAIKDRIVVAAGEGAVVITSLQPAGKRMLSVAEFLRGYRLQRGDRFAPE